MARIEGKRRVPVKFTITRHDGIDIITPAQKFAPGQVFEVTVRESARASESRQHSRDPSSLPPAELTTRVTIAAAPLRLTQASLRAGPQAHEGVNVAAPASCSESFAAVKVPVRVVLPPELEPLRDYLLYRTRFDGRTWDRRPNLCKSFDPGRTWTGETGTDMVFAVCGPRDEDAVRRMERYGERPDFPEPGRHSVEVVVSTPDGSQTITTPAISVDLSCAPPEVSPAQPTAPPEAPAPSGPIAPADPPNHWSSAARSVNRASRGCWARRGGSGAAGRDELGAPGAPHRHEAEHQDPEDAAAQEGIDGRHLGPRALDRLRVDLHRRHRPLVFRTIGLDDVPLPVVLHLGEGRLRLHELVA
ncbi:hypothetical protein OV079_22565 [Nannocystis pusilla]|uniref:Uncharacterized protein n=1 Tax=Nannocystis pusilla TaxID=889268 RepID=A0A9X3IZT4_9BACT|nr:hypothetical protein [Nannocystis pusilla]MCY1008293.1 hypothetical protein [Nannocystis pusilla]